jgi:hypothetical protein
MAIGLAPITRAVRDLRPTDATSELQWDPTRPQVVDHNALARQRLVHQRRIDPEDELVAEAPPDGVRRARGCAWGFAERLR